jgi:anti-anti-sigma factor
MDANGDPVKVIVTGDVDMATVSEWAVRFDAAIADGAADVVADLAAVTFIDSTGLSLLARIRTQLADQDRRLLLERPAACVTRLLALAGVEQHFAMHDLDDQPQP